MIDVILPVLDERTAIPSVLASLPEEYRAIVVDNGSTDRSAEVARSLGARVVSEPRLGFGAACFAGLVASDSSVVCFMDCDGSFDGADLLRVAAPVIEGTADLVIGARRPTVRSSWPVHAQVANRVLAAALRRRTHLRLHDIGPMRAVRREALLDLQLVDRRFGWPLEMVLRASAAGWRIAEVDVAYRPRVGRSKVTGTLVGTTRAVIDMQHIARTVPGREDRSPRNRGLARAERTRSQAADALSGRHPRGSP